MNAQDKIAWDKEIEEALLAAEEQALNDPARIDHQTVMDHVRQAMGKER